MTNTFVYLIKAGQTNNYKIGISSDIENRINTLQTAHYEKLTIIDRVEFSTRFIALVIEEKLHELYKDFNTIGEWFRLNIQQVEDIKKILTEELSEVVLLKAYIKELEQKAKSNYPFTVKKIPTIIKTDSETIVALWGSATTGEKLTPKAKVINVESRREVQALSKIYKTLVKYGHIELRGNKGYFALVDLKEALQGVQDEN